MKCIMLYTRYSEANEQAVVLLVFLLSLSTSFLSGALLYNAL